MKKLRIVVICVVFFAVSMLQILPTLFSVADIDIVEDKSESLTDDGITGLGGKNAQNDYLELYINEKNICNMRIKDIKSKQIWSIAPENYDTDDIAEGTIKNDMVSQLLVTYCDEDNTVFYVNSQVGSIRRETYKIRKYKDGTGFQIEYNFSRDMEQFIIPVRYQLVDNTLSVEIMYNSIKEYGDKRIVNITLLPYFLSGYKDTHGYLFVPDGSGMLVDYSTQKSWASTYEEMIYGEDYAKTKIKQVSKNENIFLPVFGACYESSSITAIIESGDYNAYIGSNPAGKHCNYSNVYPKFIYRLTDTTVLSDKDWNSRDVSLVNSKPLEKNPKIRYCFSTQENTYNGMAKTYREYLMKQKGYKRIESQNNSPALQLQFYGMSKKKDSFLGFTIDKKVVATDFKDVSKVLALVNEKDKINTHVLLYGFEKGGYQDLYTKKVTLDKKVGGKKELQELVKLSDKYNSSISIVYEPMIVYKKPAFMFRFNTAAKRLDQQISTCDDYLLSTGEKLKTNAFFLQSDIINKNSISFSKSALNNGLGVAFESAGQKLYSDFSRNYSDREKIASSVSEAVEISAKTNTNTLVFGGNEFVAKAAKKVSDIPIRSSGFDLEYKSIPFYQLVMHGLITMTGKPMNLSSNSQDDYLRSLQTGTQLKYSLVGKNINDISETNLNFLINSHFESFNVISENQRGFNEVHSKLQNQFIDTFETIGNVTKTKYENGIIIYANFAENEQHIDGLTIPKKSYEIKQVGD